MKTKNKLINLRNDLCNHARSLGLSFTTEPGVMSGIYILMPDNSYEYVSTIERINAIKADINEN